MTKHKEGNAKEEEVDSGDKLRKGTIFEGDEENNEDLSNDEKEKRMAKTNNRDEKVIQEMEGREKVVARTVVNCKSRTKRYKK